MIGIEKGCILFFQIGEAFQHTIEEIEEKFINSNDPEDVELREKLSKALPIKKDNPIL